MSPWDTHHPEGTFTQTLVMFLRYFDVWECGNGLCLGMHRNGTMFKGDKGRKTYLNRVLTKFRCSLLVRLQREGGGRVHMLASLRKILLEFGGSWFVGATFDPGVCPTDPWLQVGLWAMDARAASQKTRKRGEWIGRGCPEKEFSGIP